MSPYRSLDDAVLHGQEDYAAPLEGDCHLNIY